MDGVVFPPGPDRDNVFRSRALTALAIQDLTGCSAADAAAGVIDCFDDQGVDGVAVSADHNRVWLLQTKWSDQGTGGIDMSSTLKFLRGVEMLQDGEYTEFCDHLDRVRDGLDRAMNNPGVRVTLVLVLFGKQQPAPVLRAEFDKFLAGVNDLHPMADLVVLNFAEIYEVVRRGADTAAADLALTLEQWGYLPEPFPAYYGSVAASEIAEWYAAAGERLFGRNIRGSLDLTDVNQGIRSTLRTAPESFWYLNNGITILCASLTKAFAGGSRAFGKFELSGANVVNGAQTVSSIHEVAREDPDVVANARVWVRLITLDACPPGFAAQVTEATNTQNQVVARDFVALDPVQATLRQDFALTLGKTYVVKRGEPEPEPAHGCSVVDVANALACADPDARHVARAQQGAAMWERGDQGTYSTLFRRAPSAERAWLLVGFLREVAARLQAEEAGREGRALRVVATARYLIAHVLLRYAADDGGADPDRPAWPALLAKVGELVDLLTVTIDTHYSPHSAIPAIMGDGDRCVDLAATALDHLRSGSGPVDLPAQYSTAARKERVTRRPNAVTVLVDAGTLPDGTPLRFVPRTSRQIEAFGRWIDADPRRGIATWVNRRGSPLLWAADGRYYSPSKLVMDMISEVGIVVKAVQGTRHWQTEDGRILVDIAEAVRSGES